MKLVIIEGTDNTGKDTIISKLLEIYPTSTVIHCGKPVTKKYSSQEQDELFKLYANNIVNKLYDNTHIIIMNRSHIGEYVYGTMYRTRDETEVADMIENINNILLSRKDLDIKYIQLLCTSEKLLHRNEDGKSLSNGNNILILEEVEKFKEIYIHCNIPKKIINVNDGDEFRSRNDIFKDVLKFINE